MCNVFDCTKGYQDSMACHTTGTLRAMGESVTARDDKQGARNTNETAATEEDTNAITWETGTTATAKSAEE